MSKLKSYKIEPVAPEDPEEEPKDDQDEQDDEPVDQDAQASGFLPAFEDLTVLDFFAAAVAANLVNSMATGTATDKDRDVVADRVFKMAQAMVRVRAQIEDEAGEHEEAEVEETEQ